MKNGGLLFLKPAWDSTWWLAQGYEVRPYSDFDALGKIKKASLNLVASPYYRRASLIGSRFLRQLQARWSGKPTRLHYHLLEPILKVHKKEVMETRFRKGQASTI